MKDSSSRSHSPSVQDQLYNTVFSEGKICLQYGRAFCLSNSVMSLKNITSGGISFVLTQTWPY